MEDLRTYFAAICRIESQATPESTKKKPIHRTISDRTVYAGIELPANLQPRPHLDIVDLDKFVATHLERLDSQSAILQKISVANLRALKNTLESLTHSI